MKGMTKKALPILLSAIIAVSITGCRNDVKRSTADELAVQTESNQTESDQEIVTIPLTAETAEIREEMQAKGSNHALSEENFPAMLQALQNRGGQEFPRIETNKTQGHTVIAENDVYTLENENADCVILYLHGGAYAFGIGEAHIEFCDKLSERMNAKVYLPLYPLAPQATYQEAYTFLDAVYGKVLKEGKPVYLMGDSAGGGLSLAFAEHLRDQRVQLPNKMILLSPWVDVTMSDPEIAAYEKKDLQLDRYGLVELGKLWAGDLDTKAPLISPIYGDFKNLPSTMIFTGSDEVMVPDNTKLYHKMKEAGNDCTLVFGEGLWHVFVIDDIPEAVTAQNMIEDFCR